jgi:simple sugar transport system ATP-binding protein
VLVTHNPQHALTVGDRYVVLRRGSVVADLRRGAIDAAGLARLMEGVDGPDPEARAGG